MCRKNGVISIPSSDQHDGKTFSTLAVQKLLGLKLLSDNFVSCLNDLYCPTVKGICNLKKSYCNKCSLYFATRTRYITHCKNINKKVQESCIENDETRETDEIKIVLDNEYSIVSHSQTFECPWSEL